MSDDCNKLDRIDIYLYMYLEINKKEFPSAEMSIFELDSTVQKNTYPTSEERFPNTNPLIANYEGRFPKIFVDSPYRVVIRDKYGTQVFCDSYE